MVMVVLGYIVYAEGYSWMGGGGRKKEKKFEGG